MIALSSAQTKSGRLASCLHVRQTGGFWMYEANASTEMKPVRAESRWRCERKTSERLWGIPKCPENRAN